MSASKKTISLPASLLKKAEERVRDLHYATFSDYLQELIRRDTMGHKEDGLALSEAPLPYRADPKKKPK